jgi:general secretion pathway protein I
MPVDRARGFTLLEVLIAFVIAALALAVLFGGVSEGLNAVQLAGHYEQALSRARSRLAALSAGKLQPGEQAGDDGGGFRWRTNVTQLSAVPTDAPPARLVLYDVGVAISWKSGGTERQVRLTSQRLSVFAP